MAVADAAGEHDRPGEELAHRAHEGEGIEPAGLAAGARGQKHEAVGAGGELNHFGDEVQKVFWV